MDLTKYTETHQFTFDQTFDDQQTNHQIYQSCVKPLVESAFKEFKTTCFAYGQTGSGKTYTMLGNANSGQPGLYLLAAYDIFELIKQFPHISVSISFYEIYCGKLFDLLNDRQLLHAREDAKANVNIVGLTQIEVTF